MTPVESYLSAGVVVLLPVAGTKPFVARFISTQARMVLSLLATVAIIGSLLGLFDLLAAPLALALVAPLFQGVLIVFAYRRFVGRYGREPIDAVLNMAPDIWPDRFLAFSITLPGILLPLFLTNWLFPPG